VTRSYDAVSQATLAVVEHAGVEPPILPPHPPHGCPARGRRGGGV